MPVPMAEQAPGYVAPIGRSWVPLGFVDNPARSAPYKDVRAQLDFPAYAGMGVSGYQLAGFANTMSCRWSAPAGVTAIAEGTRSKLQLVTPQVKGGGAAYVATLSASPGPVAQATTLAGRVRRFIGGG